MTVYFVSRHRGAQFWARYHDREGALPLAIDRYVEHFDAATTQAGDVVIGTLPLNAIVQVQQRGGQFVSLDIVTPPQRRGKELSATEMVSLGAVLTPYRVEALEARTVEAAGSARKAAAPAARDERTLTLMLVSDQLPPQLIGLDLHPTTDVWLVATSAMQGKAELLQVMLKAWNAGERGAPTTRIEAIGPCAFQALRHAAHRLLEEAASAGFSRIVLNATGGTKPMMMAFVQAAIESARNGLPVQVCYVDTADQTADSLTEAAPASLRRVLNIEQLIACSGRYVAGAAHPSEEFAQQMKRAELQRHLLRAPEWVIGVINRCLMDHEKLPPAQRASGRVLLDAQMVKILRRGHGYGRRMPPLGEHLLQSGVLRRAPQLHDDGGWMELRSPAELDFLKGGWLEAHVASCMAQCGADDWAAGLQVMGEKANELDGVVAAGNRLLVIEVKTQNQRRAADGEGERNTAAVQAFYKLDSLGTSLAPLFSERWYVSARPLDAVDLERAVNLRIRVFAPDAGEWGRPIGDLPAALREWVKQAQGTMPLSPRFTPSAVGIDGRKWGPRMTRPYEDATPALG